MQTDLLLGLITQKEERLREKRIRSESKFITICLKESFHSEKKKNEKNIFVFLYGDCPSSWSI
jgi:hypothetical protein